MTLMFFRLEINVSKGIIAKTKIDAKIFIFFKRFDFQNFVLILSLDNPVENFHIKDKFF